MRVQFSDVAIEYDDSGPRDPSIPTILFIHGYPLSRKIWQPQLRSLSGSARLVIPDLRGFGDSQASLGVYSMEMLADDCIKLLDQLGLINPIVICGLSMGGYIAFALYRKYPQRVQALILSATRAGADSQETKVNRDKAIALAEKEGTQAIVRLMLPKMFAPNTYIDHPELVEFVRNIILSASVPGITGVLAGMRDRPDYTSILPYIKVPTLLIFGDQDQFVQPSEVENMCKVIPSGQLQYIHNTGHLLNLEQPEIYNNHVRNFLASLSKLEYSECSPCVPDVLYCMYLAMI
jgi:3-oxoadipate enol-lactonase